MSPPAQMRQDEEGLLPGAEAAPAGAAFGAVGADQAGQADEGAAGSGIAAR
ncbi:hypothetical protein GCM10010466_34920 [Planomonospora alba]|uniref:Uncharacterized protein n=1 Tax=Planomonospora alba TaxID=161354 RepID=A0ABP6N9I8_9ACTN